MKANIFAVIAALSSSMILACAQDTAFTYQGRLSDGLSPASGLYDMKFTVFDAVTNGNVVAGPISKTGAAVSSGLFALTLDFGAGVFDGNARWLELAVQTNGGSQFVTLAPRQAITATPYAITAGDVTGANIARLDVPNTTVQATGHPIVTGGSISSAVVDNGGSGYTTAPAVTVNANGPGSGAKMRASVSGGSVVEINVTQPGSGYTDSATITIGPPPPNNYQVFVTSNYFPNVNVFSNAANVFVGNGTGLDGLWKLGGNGGTTPGANFVGTTDNQPLELKANNQRALRVEPNTKGAPNLIGGSLINFVGPTTVGAVIAGGGATNYDFASHTNSVEADFGTIGGGLHHAIEADAIYSTIAGGYYNTIRNAALVSTIGGGGNNRIEAGAYNSTIAGGTANAILPDAMNSSISGGVYNMIEDGARDSSMGGGFNNTIQAGADGATIAGGTNNTIRAGAYGATMGGGNQNTNGVNAYVATIAGGRNNMIQSNAYGGTIGGGSNNTIQTSAYGATIGGGFSNTAAGPQAAIPGGNYNFAGANSFAAGHYAQALHEGCFVWSDSVRTDVKSTAANQFVVGASGGMWLQGTNTSLKVDGTASFPGGITGYTYVNGGLQVYNGNTVVNGIAYLYGGATISSGATINNGASIYGYSYLNGGAVINNGATINGHATLNNGATIYNGTYLYQGAQIYHGLQLNGTFGSGWQLYLTSQYAGKPGGGSWGDNSDARLKKNIRPLTGALEKLTKLRGVTFDWINPADHGNQTNRQSGFIAQEVEQVFPEWITQMGASEHDKALTADGKVRTLSLPYGYDALVVESVKELRAENLELKARVEKLEKLVTALSHKLD